MENLPVVLLMMSIGITVSEAALHTSHEGSTWHGVAEVDLIALRQQVLATYPEGKVPDELIADRGVKQEEVLLLLVVTDGGIKSTDILQPSHDSPVGGSCSWHRGIPYISGQPVQGSSCAAVHGWW